MLKCDGRKDWCGLLVVLGGVKPERVGQWVLRKVRRERRIFYVRYLAAANS